MQASGMMTGSGTRGRVMHGFDALVEGPVASILYPENDSHIFWPIVYRLGGNKSCPSVCWCTGADICLSIPPSEVFAA